jgi:glycerophosphoryl diester phosphodiesterase
MMDARSVLRVVTTLQSAGVRVWLDGGWGIDALVGEQTRDHDDLDCVIALTDARIARDALAALGFAVALDELPTRFVVRDRSDRRVDFHTVTFDATGAATQQLQDGTMAPYPAQGFSGIGHVAGVRVACLTAAVQSLHHLGYDPDEKDHHDMGLLADRLGIELPAPYRRERSRMMLIYAHRGASAIHPENTLRAFRHALALGVDGIELDVHATADGIPVVIHDRDVERTTDGAGYVDEMPLARLATFDAGDGERVPTLAEVLALVGDAAQLDIEIKGAGIERAVLEVLAEYPAVTWAISSFAWDTLRTVRQLHPAAEVWPLAEHVDDDLIVIAAELASPAVSLFAGAYTAETAARLREAGLRVVVWTVNDPHEARRVADLGVYALCTDDPQGFSTFDGII